MKEGKKIMDYVKIDKFESTISVCFYIEHDEIMAIGEEMKKINEDAYMNGYNWEAFFEYYLPKYAPDVIENMEPDPEAGMYAVYYDLSPENEKRAEKLVKVIIKLIEDKEELYRIVREEGSEIEWDTLCLPSKEDMLKELLKDFNIPGLS